MTTINVNVRTSEGFQYRDINLTDIVSVSKIHTKLWNKNNTFKKFSPKIRLDLKTGENLSVYNVSIFSDLKKILMRDFKFVASKSEEVEYKNYSTKKAIDWYLRKSENQ